jgi:predicted DNA binding CopG/RHH family protein
MRKPSSRKAERKPIPAFRTEREERAFWETHDTADYVDWGKAAIGRFPNLKPSTTTISLRLPTPLLADLKTLANKRDVPYQSLLKVFLAERVTAEHRRGALPQKQSERTGRGAASQGAASRFHRRTNAGRG